MCGEDLVWSRVFRLESSNFICNFQGFTLIRIKSFRKWYFPNLLVTWLLHRFYVFWVRDFKYQIIRNLPNILGPTFIHFNKLSRPYIYSLLHGLRTPRESFFFQKLETFRIGQTNWAKILWGIWGISCQTISTILVLWVPCPWENVAGYLSYKKLWFLGLKHINPKCSQNKILAVKNLGNSVHISVVGALLYVYSGL